MLLPVKPCNMLNMLAQSKPLAQDRLDKKSQERPACSPKDRQMGTFWQAGLDRI